jgi:hypothetical protein
MVGDEINKFSTVRGSQMTARSTQTLLPPEILEIPASIKISVNAQVRSGLKAARIFLAAHASETFKQHGGNDHRRDSHLSNGRSIPV